MRRALVLLLVTVGCATPPAAEEEQGSNDQAVVGGVETKTAHPAVGYLAIPGGARHCTGTLIAQDVVMAAGHCWQGPSRLDFGVGEYAKDKPTYHATPSGDEMYPYAFVHPEFNYPDNDLGYVVLDTPVPESIAKAAAIGDYASIDKCAFELIGYGRSVAGPNDVKDGFFDLRKEAGLCLTGTEKSSGRLLMKGIDGTSCVGDSGGGLMVKGAAVDTLAAVVSGGESCVVGATAQFTPLSIHRDFVRTALAASRVQKP